MKTIVIFILTTCLYGIIPAQEKGSDPSGKFSGEARAAHMRWKKAHREADVIYFKSLQNALGLATRAGKLDEAVAIKEEIKRINSILSQDSSDSGKSDLAKFLVGTKWTSEFNKATVSFEKGGKAVRSLNGRNTNISYTVESNREFSIKWTAAIGKCVMANDRRSFISGEWTWTRID